MASNNLKAFNDVERHFGLYAQKVAVNKWKRPIAWDDSSTNGCTLDKNAIVHSCHSNGTYTRAIKEGNSVVSCMATTSTNSLQSVMGTALKYAGFTHRLVIQHNIHKCTTN